MVSSVNAFTCGLRKKYKIIKEWEEETALLHIKFSFSKD